MLVKQQAMDEKSAVSAEGAEEEDQGGQSGCVNETLKHIYGKCNTHFLGTDKLGNPAFIKA